MVTEPRQERSRVRREALLRAAIDLLAEGGARALTHRAVAARAGLPAASISYYFDTIQQLAAAALELHVSDRVGELDALVVGALGVADTPDEMTELMAVVLVDRAADMIVALFEFYLEAARNPALRPAVAKALDAFEALAVRALAALGAPDPERAAPAFVAVVDGFALHRLARPRPRDEELSLLRGAIRALFVASVMSDAERERWSRRLRQPPRR